MKAIIYKDYEIRAMLAGKKRMTRRLMYPQPPRGAIYKGMGFTSKHKRFGALFHYNDRDIMYTDFIKCPFYVGDVFYAKEAWQDTYQLGDYPGEIFYRSTYLEDWVGSATWVVKWRSPWHLKEINARIFRKITNIKAERLQDISEEDALKEGVMTLYSDSTLPFFAFENEWRNINGNNSWDQNPWVWVYEFEGSVE